MINDGFSHSLKSVQKLTAKVRNLLSERMAGLACHKTTNLYWLYSEILIIASTDRLQYVGSIPQGAGYFVWIFWRKRRNFNNYLYFCRKKPIKLINKIKYDKVITSLEHPYLDWGSRTTTSRITSVRQGNGCLRSTKTGRGLIGCCLMWAVVGLASLQSSSMPFFKNEKGLFCARKRKIEET